MLDRGDLHSVLLEGRAEGGLAHVEGVGRNIDRRIQIDPAKDDSGVHGRWSQRHIDFRATVQADAGRANRFL